MKQKERLQGELAATRSWARDLEPSFLEPPEGRNPADTTLIPSLRFKPSVCAGPHSYCLVFPTHLAASPVAAALGGDPTAPHPRSRSQ